MALGDAFTGLADALGGALGIPYTLRKKVKGVYDPSADAFASETNSDSSITASPPQAYSTREIDGSSILRGDMKIIMPAEINGTAQTVPDPQSDQLILGTTTFKIIAVDPIHGGADPAAFEIQCRKGGAL
jgi:N-acetylmuramoyl-L-alanine amidase